MRKVIIMFALAMGIITANAQENVTVETTNGSEQPTLTKEVYPQKEADGDLYHGLSRKLTFDRMIPPHGLEVTYDKTVHVIFPAEVRYVDLGSPDLIAGKADGAENIIRVKATVRNFPNETNMSVITEDGSFYTFNVKYAAEPLLLNVEMCDFIHDGSTVNRPNNAQEIYLKELGSESPMLVRLIMKSIHKQTEQARGEAYRLQAFRHPIPVERHLHAQRLALFPHGDKEPEQRAFRCGLHHLENRGQEGCEAYCRAGADYSAAPRAELRHPRAGQKERAHGLHDGEVHHPR